MKRLDIWMGWMLVGCVAHVPAQEPTSLSVVEPLRYQEVVTPVALPFPAPGEPFHPFLPPLNPDAASVGTTRDGHLARSMGLPLDHPALRVMPRQLARGLTYGTPPLVRALVRVAEGVQQAHPGSVLSLGHLARPFGGDIPYSVSHNAGRDVDLAFFYRDFDGNPVEPADFIPLDARGRSRAERVVFDAPRTWTVVKLLLLDETLQVQWLFISKPLRAQLLEHARGVGEPVELIQRAEEVLGQPGDSRPHNDHLHLRVMCSDADLGEGCRDMGRLTSFARDPAPIRQARILQVMGYLQDGDPEYRARAAELLGFMGARAATGRLVGLLDDPAPRVRVGAARGLELLRQATWADAVEEGPEGVTDAGLGATEPGLRGGAEQSVSDVTLDPSGAVSAVGGAEDARGTASESPLPATPGVEQTGRSVPPEGLSELADAPWQPLLLEKLRRETDPVVLEAFLALAIRLELEGIEPLLLAWLKEDQRWRGEQRQTYPGGGLPRNTFEGLPWLLARGIPAGEGMSKRQVAALALAELGRRESLPVLLDMLQQAEPMWQQQARLALTLLLNRPLTPALEASLRQQTPVWQERLLSWDEVRLEGFQQAGYKLSALTLSNSAVLVKALEGPQPQAFNAHRILERLTGARLEYVPEQFSDLQVFWWRWMKREGWKYQPKAAVVSTSKKKQKAQPSPKNSPHRAVKKKKKR